MRLRARSAMANKPKLSPEQWAEVRAVWEADERTGYAWLVTQMSLPVTPEGVGQKSRAQGWAKGGAKEPEIRPRSMPARAKFVPRVVQTLGPTDEETREQRNPNRLGPHTSYRPEYAEQARKLCLLGATDAEMADFFGVAERTLYNWKESFKEFREKSDQGKFVADAEVAASLYARAVGCSHPAVHVSNNMGNITLTEVEKHYPPDTAAAMLWLKNRRPKQWRDKVEVEADVDLRVFPPKEVLDSLYADSLRRAGERAAILSNRRERLGILIDATEADVD